MLMVFGAARVISPVRPLKLRSDDINAIKENIAYEIHAHMVRTPARLTDRIRECPEADTGGIHSMEGTRQFQDRVVRYTSGRLGWVYDVGLRRSVSGSQVLLDAASFRIRGAPRGSGDGRC